MKFHKYLQSIVIAFLLSLPGISVAQSSAPDDASFGFAVLQHIYAEHTDENIIISPNNIRTALAVLATGAEGKTKQQIVALTGDYKSIKNPPFKTAQSAIDIWVTPTGLLQPTFAAGLSDVHVQSTQPEDASKAINRFVSQQTHGMITKVWEDRDITSTTRLVLTSVLSFEGTWLSPFDERSTRPRPFHFADGRTVDVASMLKTDHDFDYAENDSGQLIRLYYRGEDLMMTVFLPRPQISLHAWLASANATSWKAMLSGLRRQPGLLQIPKLNSSFSTQLNDVLKALGMTRPFGGDAQFGGVMKDGKLKVDEVLHKTTFTMNEFSTKASAALAIEMESGAAPAGPPEHWFSMVVDRPFFLTISDHTNDHILFMGVVNAP